MSHQVPRLEEFMKPFVESLVRKERVADASTVEAVKRPVVATTDNRQQGHESATGP